MPNNNSQIDKTRQDRLNAFIAKKKQQPLDTTDTSHESGKETTTSQQVKPSRQDRLNAFIAKKKEQNIVEPPTTSQEQEIAADSTTLQPTATDTIVLRGEPVVGVSIDNTTQQKVNDNAVADNEISQDEATVLSEQKPYNIPTFRTPIEERPQTDSFMAGIDARIDAVADDLVQRYKDEENERRVESDKKPLWYKAFVGAGDADEGMRMSKAVDEGIRRRRATGADRIIKEVMTFNDQQKADLDATIAEQVNEDKDYQIARAEYEEDVRTLLGDKQQLSDSESAEIMQSLTPEQKKQAEGEVARVQAEIERLTNAFNLASQEVAKRVSGRVNNDIINRIIDRLATRNMPQSDLEYIGKAIYNNSVVGMLYETAVKAASGSSWADYTVSTKGLEKYDASTAAKVAGGVGALLLDSGVFSIASLGGAAAAGAINSLATRIVATRIAQGSATTLAKGALKETAKRIATGKAINKLAANIISQSVTLGSYDAASSVLQQNLSNPEGIDWVEVLKRAGSGAASGAAIGVIGAGMQTIKGMPRVDALKAKGLPVDFTLGTVGLLAENAAFVGVGSLVSGEEADWQSFAEGLATLGILKGVGALKAGLHNPFNNRIRSFAERTLNDLRFTAEEEAAFRKAGIDADGLEIIRSTLEHIESVEPASSERKALSLAYNEAMASKDVPLSAKVKLQYIVTGRVQNVPDVLEMKIVEPTEYGEPFVVNSYDRNGRLLSISEFADGGQARAYINKYKPLIERNTIAQYENMVNGVSRIVALDRSVRAYAERENVDAQSVFNDALVYLGIVKGEPLSDERKVRAEEVISTARNASRNYLRDIIRRVAVRNEASSQEVWQALNVKPYLRTSKENSLVEDYVREIKDFVGRPIDIRPPQPNTTKRISEESSVKPEAQQTPPQGPTTPPQNPPTQPRQSINDAMRARITEAALSLSKLNSDEIVSVNIPSSPFGSGTAVVCAGYVVMDEDGDIDRSLSDSTVVVEFEDGHRATVSIDNIAEVTYHGDVTDMVRRAEQRQEQTSQMLDLINTSVDNGQSVAAKLADGTEGVISGVDEYENYIFTTKDEQGKDVSIPLSGTEIISATPIESKQTEQPQSKESSEDAGASEQAQEPEYDEDFPPLTEADFAPTIDFETIKWAELSPKDWTDTMRMYGAQTDEAPDALVVRSARSYYLNSKNRAASVDKQIAAKDKEIEKLRAGLGRAINPQDTIKQSKRIQKVQSERDALVASKDAIAKEMAQYEYALREYGIDINAEESLLRERDSLQRERAELVEADAELERTNDKLASQELKTIVNTEQNRNRVYNLYVERGVTPEQAGLRQAVLWDIATGNVHLRWEDGQNANGTKVKGLASELGLGGSAADKRAYKSIVAKNGDSIDAYVHSLWEQRGGYTADLDDIDMKNEVLDVLQSAPNGSRALEQLYDMLGISADREEGFGQSKAEIEGRIKDVDARIVANQRAIADFNKGVNDVIGRLERGEVVAQNATTEQPQNVGGRGNVIEHTGGEASFENREQLSNEVDEDGSPFVLSSTGSTVFGEISAKTGLTPAPIKLSRGNSQYGLIHIEKRHGEQIQKAGFNSVEEFVEYVCKNYNRIRQGENSIGEPNGTYLLQSEGVHNDTLYIELSKGGDYWGINSGGTFREDYGDDKKEVWSASEVQNEQSAADSTLRDDDKSDNQTTPNGYVPITSDNKGNAFTSEKQEIAEKVEGGDKMQASAVGEQVQATEAGADAIPQSKEQQSANAQSVQSKIEDYGEVIAGARKDAMKELAKSVNNATLESLISLPFAKAFKRPNLKKAVEEGALRPQDARFAAAVMASYLSEKKPKADTKKDRYRKAALGKSNVEAWAEKAYGGVQILKRLFEAEPQERDVIIKEATKQRFFDIDKVKEHQKRLEEWNPGRTFNGESYPINPVVLFDEVFKRLGDDIGESEIPVSRVLPADSAAEEYSLNKSNGDRIFLNSQLRTFDDVVDAIVYLTKLANGETDIDHPKEQFAVRGTERINDVVGYYVKYFPSAKSMTPKDAEFKTKADADAFYNKIAAKGGTALEPREITQTTGYSQYGVFFKNPLTEEYIDIGVSGKNKAELSAAIDQDYDVLNQKVNAKLSEVNEKSSKKKPEYVEVRSYFEGRGKLKYGVAISDKYNPRTTFDTMPYYFADGFSTRKEAEAALEENRTKWEDYVQDMLRQQRDFVYFNDGAEARVGEDYRKGENISEKEFAETFGFRGVQFGNWANQADRQAAVNNAYDSFMDLAKVLGVSPRALSLNGELGIAFGSRGSGKANAHYEADEVVINLTKTRGAGSLAHEWWHALDNYFARQANVPKGFATADKRIQMREQMRQAFNDLIDHVEKSDYNTRSRKRGNYWGDPIEETARLFGEWVVDELAKRGERNHFLSRGIGDAEANYAEMNYLFYKLAMESSNAHRANQHLPEKPVMTFDEFKKTPRALEGFVYPSAEELKTLGEDVRNLFDTVQERVDEETGNVVLFHREEKQPYQEITYDNFYLGTVGTFEETSRPDRKPDYVSYSKDNPNKVSSMYWYGEDAGGKYVIRGSDHWSYNGEGGNISSCYWYFRPADAVDYYPGAQSLPRNRFAYGDIAYGKVYLNDMRFRAKNLNTTPPTGIDAGRWNAIVDMVKDSVGAENVITDPVQVKAEYDRIVAGQQRVRERIVEDANSKFNEQLEQQIAGTLAQKHIYNLGTPSPILLSCGLPNLPIELASTRLKHKSIQDNHPFNLEEIKDIVRAIQDPLAVFRSATRIGSNVILTELKHGDKSFVVAVKTNRYKGRIAINDIRSVYYRDSDMDIVNWINEELADYIKPTFEQEWLEPAIKKLRSKPQYNSAEVRAQLKSCAKIIKDFENPKVEAENLRQCIVYHGSSADFEAFDHSHMGEGEGAQAYGWGTYVTEVNGIARSYAEKTAKDSRSNLYTVDIPNDNGENYLKWNARIKASQAKRILDWIENSPYKKAFEHEKHVYEQVGEKFKPIEGRTGREVYEFLQQIMYDVRENRTNAPKLASQALSDMGFVGMSYPAQYRSGGRSDGARNYVIFDEKNAQIIDHERYFRTPNGEVYGFTIGNRIYLDSSKMNPETPIHEYTELWSKVVADNQPEVWARGKELLKETKTWKEVNSDKNYKNLSEDERASETVSRITAKIAAKKMSEIADDRTLVAKLRAWLRKFWGHLKGTFEKWTDADLAKMTVEDFVMMPLRDLAYKVNLAKYTKAKAKQADDARLAQNRAELDAIQSERDAIITKAKADGTYMKAPNGKPTHLTEREWVDVHTPRFKQWFGDWEKAARIEKLRNSNDVKVKYNGEYPLNASDAQNWIKANLRRDYRIKDTNETVALTGVGAKEVTSHNRMDEIHLKSVSAIPQMLENAIFIDEEKNEKGNGKFDSYRYYAVGLNIDGVPYTAKLIVGVKQGKKYYDHHLTQIEKTRLIDNVSQPTSDFTTEGNASLPPYIGSEDRRLFSIMQINTSKVVDENGEPLAVYHGTSKRWYGGKFNTFNTDNHPVWFTPDRSYAEVYSTADDRKQHRLDRPQVYSTFLNMRNIKDIGRINYGGTNALVEFSKQTGIPLEDIKAINAERYREEFGEEVSNPNDIRMVYDLVNSRQFKDYLSQKGYDGMRALEGNNTTFAAFYPNQVKSATDNIGTYDAQENDIRFMFAGENVVGSDARISESTEAEGGVEGREATNQSRIDELVARLASLQAQARNRNQDVRALTAEVIKFVKDKTNDIVLKNLGEQRFRSIMNGVQAALAKITATRATSEWQMAEIRKALDKIDTRITEALIKDNREAIEKLLNLRVYKFNPMGVKMGNRISENTRQIFDKVQAGITLKSKKWSDEENRYVYYYTLTEKAADTSETLADIEREMYELPPEDNSVMHKIAAVQILKRYNDAIVIYDTIDEIEKIINTKTAERSAAFRAKQEALEANNLDTHAKELVKWRNLKGEIAGLQADLLNRKHLYNDALATFRQGLKTLVEDGRNAWIDAVHKEAEQRMNLMRTAFSSIRVPSAIPYKKTEVGDEVVEIKENRNNELKALVSNWLPAVATFDSVLRAICINDIGNRYGLYDEIMGGEDGLVFASDNEYKNKQKMFSAVEAKIKAFHLGKDMNDLIAITKKPSGAHITNKGNKGNIELTIGELMYIYASSRQEQGRKMLINAGIEDMHIDTMADLLVEVYPDEWRFVNWVTDEFLPAQRYERYNGLYEDLYKTQMPDTPHYFPLVVNKEQLYKAEEIGEGDVSVLPTSTVGSIIARREHNYGLNLDTNFVGQLISHINDMEHWYAFAKPIKQINTLLSSTQFRNVVEAQAKGAVSLLKEVANIAVGGRTNSGAGVFSKTLKTITRNDIASNITFRFNTALKQALSYPVYFSYSASPRYWLCLARAFNPKNIPANWKWAINELPTVKERWESRSAGFDQINANDFSVMYGRIVGKVVSAGMLANSAVDLLTCAVGARAIYEFEYDNNIKAGMTAAAAEVDAKYRAALFLNQTQQSGNNIFLSRMQKKVGLTSQFMAYRNANLGYARLETHAIAEAKRAVDKGTKRRRIAARTAYYKRIGMNDTQAEHKAKHDHWQNFLASLLKLGILCGVAPLLWADGSKGLLGYRPDTDDDDEESGISFIPYLSDYPFYGPAISDVISNASNFNIRKLKLISLPTLETFSHNAVLIYDRLSSDGKKADRYDTTVAFSVATLAMRYGIALDPKTFENMYHGVKGMTRDGMDYEDIMEIFNVPRSSVKAIVGRIREGETKEEYMQRLSFANRRIRSNMVLDKKIEKQYFEALNNKFYKEMGISPSEVDKFEKKANKAKNRLHLTSTGYVKEDYLDDYDKMPAEQAALVDSLGNRIYDLQWYDYGLKTAIEPDSIYKADLKSRYEVLKQLNEEYDKYIKKYGN